MRKMLFSVICLVLLLGTAEIVSAETIPQGSFGRTIYHNGTDWASSSLLYNNGTKIGIGTTNPEFKLSLDNDGGIISKGSLYSGTTLTTSGAGTRMIWYPRKAAFRAGSVEEDRWDDVNIGNNSVAFGENTKASGLGSVAMGLNCHATGQGAPVALGNGNIASGNAGAVALGSYTQASGSFGATAIGFMTKATGEGGSTALGNYTEAAGQFGTTAMGTDITVTGRSSFGVNVENTVPVTVSQDHTIALMGGPVGIGTASPVSKLEVDGVNGYNQFRMKKSYTPTATSDPNGSIGDMAWDNNYLYIKTSQGWKRVQLSTFTAPSRPAHTK